MAQILQRPTELGQKLILPAEGKDGADAELVIGNLTSQPLEDDLDAEVAEEASLHNHLDDHLAHGRRSRSRRRRKSSSKLFPIVTDRSPDVDNNSEDDDEFLDDEDLDDADVASDSDGAGGAEVPPEAR